MSDMETGNNSEHRIHRKPLERMSYANKGRFFKLRNILNLVFIILAVVGMIIYFQSNSFIGGAILVVSVIIKFAESVLRLMH